MKIIILSILAFGITLVLFISGCTQPPPLDLTTYQPWPTDTPTPTDLPTPTETLKPTRTPIPTIPPTATIPAPEKSSEFLNNVQVVYLDTFVDQ
jgi:hypothetical protein